MKAFQQFVIHFRSIFISSLPKNNYKNRTGFKIVQYKVLKSLKNFLELYFNFISHFRHYF